MAAKQVYTVRLDADQVKALEAKADGLGLSVGHVMRTAIAEYLRQEQERDYLDEVRADIVTAINRLGRQVEKDRVEQQHVMGMLDYLRLWLTFTLPTPVDTAAAKEIQHARNEHFLASLPALFVNKSRAKVTAKFQLKDELDD